MPLLKKALQPGLVVEKNVVVEQTPAPIRAGVKLQPDSLDAKSRQIQRQGAFQAALQSVGVVQYGGKSFDDYLNRVREAANAELKYINEVD
jgi:hypothetical protein